MKHFCMLVLFLFGAVVASAQNFTVSGRVLDLHNKTAVAGAAISIGNYSSVSGKDGRFSLSVPGGKYQLKAEYPDAAEFSEAISVTKSLEVEIRLETHAKEIETVHLVQHKKGGTLVVKSISSEELAKNATENLGNLLSGVSGVNTLKTGNNITKPIIHGLYGSRILVMNNGVRLAEQEWGVEHAPNVDPANYDHIDVIKGASALRYGGDAVGGVVVLEPPIIPKKDTVFGQASLSWISNGRGVSTSVKLAEAWRNGWSVHSGGSFMKLGDQQTPTYGLMNSALQNSSFNFGVKKSGVKNGFSADYYLTNQTIGILSSSHVSSSKDLAEALQSNEPLYQRDFSYKILNPKQDIEHHLAKISAFNRFENFGKVTATLGLQYNHRKEYDIRRGAELSKIASLDLGLITASFNLNHLLERERWSLESGIDAEYQNNYSNPATEARRLIPNYDKYSGGAYSVFKYRLSPSLNAEFGARYDHSYYDVVKWYNLDDWENWYAGEFPQFVVRINQNRILTKPQIRFNNLSFNGGLEFHPSGMFNLKFNYARVSRTPNAAELFAEGLHHSAGIYELGDLKMKPETGNQFNLVADARFNLLDGLDVSVNPYFFYTKNFINQIPDGYRNTQWDNFIIWKYQQIDAKMYGLDVDAKWQLTKNLLYKGRASLLHGDDATHNEPLILMAPANFTNSLEFSKKNWNNFYLEVENTTVLHQNRFPVHNLDIELFDSLGNPVIKTVDISTPPPGYALWNLRAGFSPAKNLSADVSVKNLFNTSYRDYLNRLRYFSSEMGRNIIVTLKYNF